MAVERWPWEAEAQEPDWLKAKRARVNERLRATLMVPALIGGGDQSNWESYRWSATDLAWLDKHVPPLP